MAGEVIQIVDTYVTSFYLCFKKTVGVRKEEGLEAAAAKNGNYLTGRCG